MKRRKRVLHKLSASKKSGPMRSTKCLTDQEVAENTSELSGEGGIRTPGAVLPARRFSKAVLSTTQPPLRHGES